MTINSSDITLKQAERLTDTDDGGGQMTGNAVIDGEVNNLFPDISRLDRTTGRVNLRKAFLHADTDNSDVYYGSHVIVSKQPDDPNVSLALFDTDSPSDERANAQNRIEGYLVKGIATGWRLFGDHFKGQASLSWLQRVDDPVPLIGDTYLLVHDGAEEYVRISDVTTEDRTFTTFEGGDSRTFKRRVTTIDLFQPIDNDWPGDSPSFFSANPSGANIHESVVADAARYFGITELSAASSAGDKTVTVDSIFATIVPTTQEETALLDQRAAADLVKIVEAGDEQTLTDTFDSGSDSSPFSFYFGRPIAPNTANFTINSGGSRLEVEDDGFGNLEVVAAVGGGNLQVGTVDYEQGRVTITFNVWFGGSATITLKAKPGVVVNEASETAADEVTQGTRSYTWVWTLETLPAPGAVAVSFRSLGRWYTLRDNGRGKLAGTAEAEGVGAINYATGTLNVTLGYLPDVGSHIIRTWGGLFNVEDLTSHLQPALTFEYLLGAAPVPGSVALAWEAGGVARSATDDGAGNLTGDATGRVEYANRKIVLVPDLLPDVGTTLTTDYNDKARSSYSSAVSASGGNLPIDFGEAIDAGTVYLDVPVTVKDYRGTDRAATLAVRDDGAGNLTGRMFSTAANARFPDRAVGTVDYSAGTASIDLSTLTYTYRQFQRIVRVARWLPVQGTATFTDGDTVTGYYFGTSGVPVGGSAGHTIDAIDLDLTSEFQGEIAPGGLLFTLGGRTYIDRQGSLYYGHNPKTDAATLAASLDHEAGTATLTDWPGGDPNTLQLLAGKGLVGEWTFDELVFRLAANTIKPASFSIRGTPDNGSQGIGTSDQVGNVNGDWFTGTVDYDTTVVALTFSVPLLPSSLFYNAVAIKFIPLSEELIGLDPIRLPGDGRVPIFRDADIVVLHHTLDEVLPSPLSAGQTVTINRAPVSSARILANDGTVVPEDRYTFDPETGEIDFADPLDKTGLPEPWIAEHRREDMLLVAEAQIGGGMTFLTPLTWDFPAGTKVSTALPFGDLQSRVSNLFTQATWNNTWADQRSGSDTAAKYNDVQNPIVVTNAHSLQERWAIHFTSTTTFQVIGEVLGIIATGNTSSETAPTNPQTGGPYFEIAAAGWGTGWQAGNVLRFNTHAASHPMWLARTTTSGTASTDEDSGRIEIRGDAQ